MTCKTKLVIVTDETSAEALNSLVATQLEDNVGCEIEIHIVAEQTLRVSLTRPVSIHYWQTTSIPALEQLLAAQFIGTRVLIFAAWIRIQGLVELVKRAGYAADEYQIQGYGLRQYPVLCAGCYGINGPTPQRRVTCQFCARDLVVSNHYSPRLNAVLGYLSISGLEAQQHHDAS